MLEVDLVEVQHFCQCHLNPKWDFQELGSTIKSLYLRRKALGRESSQSLRSYKY
jgi:hypothetical protein